MISAAKRRYHCGEPSSGSEGEEEVEAGALMPEACGRHSKTLSQALEQKYGTVIRQQ